MQSPTCHVHSQGYPNPGQTSLTVASASGETAGVAVKRARRANTIGEGMARIPWSLKGAHGARWPAGSPLVLLAHSVLPGDAGLRPDGGSGSVRIAEMSRVEWAVGASQG